MTGLYDDRPPRVDELDHPRLYTPVSCRMVGYSPGMAIQQVPVPETDLDDYACTVDDLCLASAVVMLVDPDADHWNGEAACAAHRPDE